jgi:hypothetical protein
VRFFVPSVLILLLSACLSEPDCLVTATTAVKTSLRNPATGIAKNVKFHSIQINGVHVQVPTDSVKSITLFVDPFAPQTTFTFEHASGGMPAPKSDTFTLTYTSEVVIISPDCGGVVFHTNLAVKDYTFPTAPKVVNAQLSTLATLNVEISL